MQVFTSLSIGTNNVATAATTAVAGAAAFFWGCCPAFGGIEGRNYGFGPSQEKRQKKNPKKNFLLPFSQKPNLTTRGLGT
jgi:hypothetical protein